MTKFVLALSLIFCFFSASVSRADDENAETKPLALVWGGDGACKPFCVDSAKSVAFAAGYRVRVVEEGVRDFSFFEQAKVWIQPGGVAVTALKSMGPALVQKLQDFVAQGGGYVGFCAGAFLSTAEIGSTAYEGLGVAPGITRVQRGLGSPNMLRISTTTAGNRWMYFAGGAYFEIGPEELAAMKGEVIARYSNGNVAGYQGQFGKGKVSVVGFHPEASSLWKTLRGQRDSDGSDVFYAVEMVKYATTPTVEPETEVTVEEEGSTTTTTDPEPEPEPEVDVDPEVEG